MLYAPRLHSGQKDRGLDRLSSRTSQGTRELDAPPALDEDELLWKVAERFVADAVSKGLELPPSARAGDEAAGSWIAQLFGGAWYGGASEAGTRGAARARTRLSRPQHGSFGGVPNGSGSAHAIHCEHNRRYVRVDEGGLLVASGWRPSQSDTQFDVIPRPRPGGAPDTAPGWFVLRSRRTHRFVRVVYPPAPEAWTVRADGTREEDEDAWWAVDGEGLRNGGGALLNFRGLGTDGVSVRAHGDRGPPWRACEQPSCGHTRFNLARLGEPADGGSGGGARPQPPACIALGVASRARPGQTARELALTTVLLPSLVRTAAGDADPTRFRYIVYVGHDDDDPFYADAANRLELERVVAELVGAGRITLRLLEMRGMRGAPCWVWNALFERSCSDGCGYFYQLNDDISLRTAGWAQELVDTLRENPVLPNVGVTGPLDTNNPRLMTQSFAHCTHRAIFGWYYPPTFKNWYSDDWISQVYGKQLTFWRKDIEVFHELAYQGPRYDIAYEDEARLPDAVRVGRQALEAYVRREHPESAAAVDAVSSSAA